MIYGALGTNGTRSTTLSTITEYDIKKKRDQNIQKFSMDSKFGAT